MQFHGPPRMAFILIILLLFLCPAPAAVRAEGVPPPSEEPLLTLDEAVKTALRGNRDIQNATIGVGRQQNTVDATASARYPQVSLGAKQSHVINPQDFMIKAGALGSYTGIGPIPSEDRSISQVSGSTTMVSVELLQPITTLYKVNMAVGAQKALLGITRETERSQKQAVVQNVKQAYFEMLNVQNSLDAVRDSLKFLTDLKRVIKDQLLQGSTMKAELLQVDSQLADSRYQESALLNQMLTLKQNFNVLLGRPISTAFRVALPENFQGAQEVGEDLPALEAAAEKQRPEIIQSRLRISQAEYQREVTRFEWYPDIGLYASYLNQSNTGLLPGSLGFVGLKGEWSAVDWGKRNNEVAGQVKAVDQANKQADQIHDQVMAEVSAAWRNLVLLKTRQESTRAALSSAEENFRVTYNRFKQKMALTKDVLQSQAQLSSARQQYQKSLLDFASARAELDRVTGRNP